MANEAHRLAHSLQSRGIGRGDRVGICLEQTARVPMAILAVLEAGAAYVPLDPSHPDGRLTYVASHAGLRLIITEAGLMTRAATFGPSQLCLDRDRASIDAMPASALELDGDRGQLAYVIYTSGSTGRPKGVQVSHDNVLRLFAGSREHFTFDDRDVWAMFHSYAFDFSVWEMWGALLHGGRLLMVPRAVSKLPEEWHALAHAHGVTVMNQTPSAFQQFIAADQQAAHAVSSLRYIILGGEEFNPSMLRPWATKHGLADPVVVNMYGITETTVHVTFRAIEQSDIDAGGSPIGEALEHLELHVLDAGLTPVADGTVGELYVTGAGLAWGYLGQPGLTAERFLPNPFAARPGERMYRTGDQGRWQADGDILYEGRIDRQVQLRGFRVELGEIERRLREHEGVTQAVVIVHGDDENKRLVAYLCGENDLDGMAVRAFAAQTLPSYMVPSAWARVDTIPLTTNGKIDVQALRKVSTSSDAASEDAKPSSPIEVFLGHLWAELLEIDDVNVHDDFFERGGHSLLATKIAGRLRQSLGLQVPVRAVFEHRTIAQLARAVSNGAEQGRTSGLELMHSDESSARLSHAQARIWFFEQLATESSLYIVPLSMRLRGSLDVSALEDAVSALIARHGSLRTCFVHTDDGPVQRRVAPFRISLSPEALEEGQSVESTLALEMQQLFALDAPLLRVRLVKVADDDH
ncbi:MAG: amino acid adenylation domain-containing protein, partial [Myxococcota bacterium]